MHAGLGALGGFRQADGQIGMQILAASGRAEFLRLELCARTAARRAAEHAAQDVLEAAAAATARALEAVVAEVEGFEVARARPPAARLRTFEAAEAWLALGVDLAVVERLALLVVAGDLVGGVELGEARGRLGVVLVGVGMQLLGEPPVGALDLGLARTLRYPQDLVGVAHPKLP